jgi:ABC-2 type transport system ATP-binding protein
VARASSQQDLLPEAEAKGPQQAPAPGPALVARELTKRWPTWKQPILQDIELELDPGTSTWIAGRNGTGKTTLLRLLAGVILPDRGAIRLHGFDSRRDARAYRTHVSLLTAGNTGLFARLSVSRHLDYWARIAFVPRPKRAALRERVIGTFVLDEFLGRRADRLSLGQRQRVRLALAFLHEPDLMLLDEPQTSLDDEGVAMLREAGTDLQARGGMLLWCSPIGDEPTFGDSRRLVMDSGRLTPG